MKKFLAELKTQTCPHCSNKTYLIAHSIVYRKTRYGSSITTGQRIMCSNRNNKNGCGRTFQLYLNNHIPRIHYSANEINLFLKSLIENKTIQKSYQMATSTQDQRNAYRWINKIKKKIFELKLFIKRYPPIQNDNNHKNYFIETINNLAKILKNNISQSFQNLSQQPII